jgi:hypothetical protein
LGAPFCLGGSGNIVGLSAIADPSKGYPRFLVGHWLVGLERMLCRAFLRFHASLVIKKPQGSQGIEPLLLELISE